jgi:hypothetical protein
MKTLEKYHIYEGTTKKEIRLMIEIPQLKAKYNIIDKYETP